MVNNSEILIYRSSNSSYKQAWMNCLFAIVFGSAFFLILPLMNRAPQVTVKDIEIREIPQIIKKKKIKKLNKKLDKPKEVKKLIKPVPQPPIPQAMKTVDIKIDLPPISFASEVKLSPMTLSQNFETDFAIEARPTAPVQTTKSSESAVDYSGVFELTEVDQQARRLKFVQPVYPRRAMQRGLTGTLSVQVLITKEGQVSTYKILKSPHRGIFDKACIKALLADSYKPATKNGRVVSSKRIINYDFRLK
ncbi:putative TonB2 protein [Lentisphaera araneosa HTCC2155]|uniref:Putative TonB2 protein n=1 Tax=Lentisphaera araneosa HTCC2155 TaxID=313628 RepID=A6DPL1_9BACT|nr:energy transducer TonB [Lentisphaera araneosa]EDM26507.1 putative TonB2 protein [Lentisphaera araneosa HTCC2155]